MPYTHPCFQVLTISMYVLLILQANKKRLINITDIKTPLNLITSIIKRYKTKGDFFSNITTQHNSFLIIRHPFSRLVSAFRDKLERSSSNTNYLRDYFYTRYGIMAVKRFRQAAIAKFGKDYFSAANNFGSPIPAVRDGLRGNRTEHHPIFWEFVQLIKTQSVEEMNDHWRPIFHHCHLCRVNYKHIFMHENIKVEASVIKRILNPSNNNPKATLGKYNPTSEKAYEDLIVRLYFEQLSKEDILDIYGIYKLDFMTFGYTFKYENISLPLSI